MIYRLPRGESIILPPSHCPACGHRLSPADLIPVLSFVWLKGQCRYCKGRIGGRYPAVELLCAGLTALWGWRLGMAAFTGEGIACLLLTYALVTVALIDLDHQIIPDQITLPFCIAELVFRALGGELPFAAWGILAGAGPLGLIAVLYPAGMGWGDVKLMAMVGILLGWQKGVAALFLGSLYGLVVMLPLIVSKRMDRKTPFPFGPFLALGALTSIYAWDGLMAVYQFLTR